jgi:hypothetical protein
MLNALIKELSYTPPQMTMPYGGIGHYTIQDNPIVKSNNKCYSCMSIGGKGRSLSRKSMKYIKNTKEQCDKKL